MAPDLSAMHASDSINTLWVVVATVLVFGMQNGFLLLEGGHVRAKNSINVAQKNLIDWMVTTILFLSFGFWLMFGITPPGQGSDAVQPVHFLFQLAFASTAASIISGGVAERITFRGYMILVILTSGFLYPLTGRLVWGNLFDNDVSAYLNSIGFVDFAGSTVIHALGAGVALGAILAIGARSSRFLEDGSPRDMPSFNTVISLSGSLLLIFGWLGFNAGTLSIDSMQMQYVLMNTLLCGAFGSISGCILGMHFDGGKANPNRLKTALIGGLVASSASIDHMNTYHAAIIGSIGGLIAVSIANILLNKFRFDDPLDVVASHGAAGIFGTISVAFVLPESLLISGSRILQLILQLSVSVAVFVSVAAVSYATIQILSKHIRIRVSAEEEYLGLNITEHGESIGSDALKQSLLLQIDPNSSQSQYFENSKGGEEADLAQIINILLRQQHETHDRLRESHDRFTQFANVASDWLWEVDEKLIFTYISSVDNGPQTLLNEHAVGCDFHEIFRLKEPMEIRFRNRVQAQDSFDFISAEIPLIEENKVTIHVEVRGQPFFDDNQVLRGYRGSVLDVTPRKAAEARTKFLALHDELTRLPSRRALNEILPNKLVESDKNNTCLALAGIDLDGFKSINDTYGHAIGDELLRRVTGRLTHNLGNNCSIYRTGGDEFVFVIADLQRETALEYSTDLCKRLTDRISKPYEIDTLPINIGASVGISLYPQHSTSEQALSRMADLALYAAKDNGKGCVVVYEDGMDKDERMQQAMLEELRDGIVNDEFYCEFQPIIDLKTGRVCSVEALIRWNHPTRGKILPISFIPLAERLNFSDNIFTHVLSKSSDVLNQLDSQKYDADNRIKLAINLSAIQLSRQDFSQVITDIVKSANLRPTDLEIECTSAGIASLPESACVVMHELWSKGFTLAVDDFGSGQLPVDKLIASAINTIKINRKLIGQLDKNQRARNVVKSLISLCQREEITIIANGVENVTQLEILKNIGCEQAQGYHIASPMRMDQLIDWYKDYNDKLDMIDGRPVSHDRIDSDRAA